MEGSDGHGLQSWWWGLESSAGGLRPRAGLTVRSGQGLGGAGLCFVKQAKQAQRKTETEVLVACFSWVYVVVS